jgi:hypothetical protein
MQNSYIPSVVVGPPGDPVLIRVVRVGVGQDRFSGDGFEQTHAKNSGGGSLDSKPV